MFSFAFKQNQIILEDTFVELFYETKAITGGIEELASWENTPSLILNGDSYTPIGLPVGYIDTPDSGTTSIKIEYTITSGDLAIYDSVRLEIERQEDDNLGDTIELSATSETSSAGLLELLVTFGPQINPVQFVTYRLIGTTSI